MAPPILFNDSLSISTRHPIIDAAQLALLIDHPDVIVVDCRYALNDPKAGRTLYQASHIPGAHYLNLDSDLSGEVLTHGG